MEEWIKPYGFDTTDGVAFVYRITFSDSGHYYYGSKKIWKGIKDIKRLKDTTKESDWLSYNTSSTTCKQWIAEGRPHRKEILAVLPTWNQCLYVESSLICFYGTDPLSLNYALMSKIRIPKDPDLWNVVRGIIG